MSEFRPFLVADRPASLRIIRGANPELFENGLGIMTHANVSKNVGNFIRDFPASGGFYSSGDEFEYDDESRYADDSGNLTELGQEIREDTARIVDSGAFLKEGSNFESYAKLYRHYEDLDADYGIIIDELNDPEGTIETATDAIETYRAGDYSFNLVGVAQGTSVEEYLDCYEQLLDLGYEYIAIGGLLQKHGNRSGAFAHVGSEEFLEAVLGRIRGKYPDNWLFALGCYHPNRHELFEDMDLFGADYKGWIYKYQSHYADRRKARDWRFRNVRSFIKHNTTRGTAGHPSSLLILPCSKSKLDTEHRLSAKDRYCGQFFQTLNKWERETTNPEAKVDLLIFSAKYGLIHSNHQIENYDQKLDGALTDIQQAQLNSDLYAYLKYRKYEDVYVCGGKDYRTPIKNVLQTLNSRGVTEASIGESSGKLGIQLGELRDWLDEREAPAVQHRLSATADTD